MVYTCLVHDLEQNHLKTTTLSFTMKSHEKVLLFLGEIIFTVFQDFPI